MPELPEVEVVRQGLAPALVGASISEVRVLDPRSTKRHDARRGDFVGLLEGASVTSAERRGKFLWFPLDSGDALVTHLGMSGQVLLRAPEVRTERHLRIQLRIDHPQQGEFAVNFVDQRIFGSMAVDALQPQAGSLVPSQAAHIALDPLDPAFDQAAVIARIRRKNVAIKRILLDQTVLSGVGNIYADEALWAARVHGERLGSNISVASLRTLLNEVSTVLTRALAEGGTSFDEQYVNVNGESGYFSHSLNAYGQQGRPCPRCGTPIRRVSFMNRGSHFCPRCQRR
jgi:formamidopyrimidine-DNA glycosylase